MIIVVLSHRVNKSSLLTLLAQVFAHIIKVFLITSECLACLGMTVPYEKMCVWVRLIDMDGEQHFVALKKLLCKVFRYLENFLVSELVPVLRRE